MLRTKSALKALRQSVRRKKHNLQRKAGLKKAIKTYQKAIKSRELEEAKNT